MMRRWSGDMRSQIAMTRAVSSAVARHGEPSQGCLVSARTSYTSVMHDWISRRNVPCADLWLSSSLTARLRWVTEWAVTVNLGGECQSATRKEGMLAWTRDVVREHRPAVIFAQEAFSGWLRLFDDQEYKVIRGVDRGWSVQSLLVYRSDLTLEPITETALPHLGYHGTYVAAARWHRPDGSVVALASVHASPNPAEPETYGWPSNVALPGVRNGGDDPRWPGSQLWDSDFVLLTIRDLHKVLGMPVLAAGDFNESLKDDVEGGTWAREFFDRAREYGLRSWLHEMWVDEKATRRELQLDHVFVSDDGVSLLDAGAEPRVDVNWESAEAADELSDHAAIWFALASVGEVTGSALSGESNGKTMANEKGQTP